MMKFLVVGCGGSGGSTLAYMMDQLKSDLAQHGVDSIPAGWQFVHIDVPNAPDTRAAGVENVFKQGGTYISTAPQSGDYSILDNALSQTLTSERALGEFGTWAPRVPSRITTGIGNGAGQMRAVGRAITLSRASAVYEGLDRAFTRLGTVEANAEMAEAARKVPGAGEFNAASRPVVLVVSSMAGGAGASMALDVCRLLSFVHGVDPGLVGVFMVAADVFDALPASQRTGVRPNALAMLGEIVATQTQAAGEHDLAVLSALGHRSGSVAAPFARVFPVGRFVGTERTLFGDGSQTAVYRGLGRGLSALMVSDRASHEFVDYDLVNSNPTPTDRDYFGWGAPADKLSWGAFGYASLSMGRDRYRHYSAQRLARSAVSRLRSGHVQPGSTASDSEQLAALLDSQWSRVAQAAGLPASATGTVLSVDDTMRWFTSVAFGRPEAETAARTIVDETLRPVLPVANGIPAAQWLPGLRQGLFDSKAALTTASTEAAYRWAFGWSRQLHQRLLEQVQDAVATLGIPYARAVVDRIESLVRDQLIVTLGDLAGYAGADLGQVPPAVETEVAGLRGVISNGQALVERILNALRISTTDTVYSRAAGSARDVLQSYLTDVLAPLRSALSESLAVLDNAASVAPADVGLANVHTAVYTAWPSDDDLSVPERFDVADNEILLTAAAGFGRQYESDVIQAVAGGAGPVGFIDARDRLIPLVVTGVWPVASGAEPPGGLLRLITEWRPAHFNRDPFTQAVLTPSRARYEFALTPAELGSRSLDYVSRRGESFERFCSVSLRDYALGTDIPPSELPARTAEIVAKFNETLTRALPLVSVNADAVNAIHSQPTQYRFKFSDVPFENVGGLVHSLQQTLQARPNVDPETVNIFDRALNSDEVTRIDIFGSYQDYSPLVFDSVLVPVSKQWAATPAPGREDFWANRRTRTLPASLPMGDDERRAMIAGWYIGQLTGQIRIPGAPFEDGVQIWDDEQRRWISFPNPLLTPPDRFVGLTFDWLPAVLESVLLAIARSHDVPVMSSMRPYRLLRQLFDASSQGPATGLRSTETSGVTILAEWLATGATPSGDPSKVEGESIAERAEAAIEWLEKVHEFTGVNFVAPGRAGAPGGGSMSVIRSRNEASAMPIFRDLAEDIYLVTERLQATVTQASERASDRQRTGSGSAVSTGFGQASAGSSPLVPQSDPLVPQSDFGSF